MCEKADHIHRYQLCKLSKLLDDFECLMDDSVTGKMKSYEDYPNILLQAAGKSSLTLRAIIQLCTSGFPDATLVLARQIYEQSIILSFFDQIKQRQDFDKYVEDYYADYSLQIAKYNKWQAEHIKKDSSEIAEYQKKIEEIEQKKHHKIKGDYWWTGMPRFYDIVDFLMKCVDEKVATLMAKNHLLYMRACKDVHAGVLGNILRLGSDSDKCGVDNSAKTSGHGLPLYLAVFSFNIINLIVCSNLNIDGKEIFHEFDKLVDLYAAADEESNV